MLAGAARAGGIGKGLITHQKLYHFAFYETLPSSSYIPDIYIQVSICIKILKYKPHTFCLLFQYMRALGKIWGSRALSSTLMGMNDHFISSQEHVQMVGHFNKGTVSKMLNQKVLP